MITKVPGTIQIIQFSFLHLRAKACHVLLATILLRDDEPTSLSESRWENADVGGKLRALRIGGLMRTKLVEHQPEYFSNLLAIGTSSTFDYCIKTKIGFRNFGLLLENGMQGPQAPLLIPVVVVKRTEVKWNKTMSCKKYYALVFHYVIGKAEAGQMLPCHYIDSILNVN